MAGQGKTVFFFGPGQCEADSSDRGVLGGKGASLVAMMRAGLPVPPGFIISADCCRHVLEHAGQWPDGLEAEAGENLARLEQATGRRFGQGKEPLLVSVRSGAAASMPGMMDTILNCGVHPGLATDVGDTPRFWEVLSEFVLRFAEVAAGMSRAEFTTPEGASEPPGSRESAERLIRRFAELAGRPFPSDPRTQLRECIQAVFRSWDSPRAMAYRSRHAIAGLAGTAVTVQAMFPSQVSGVLFTQNPTNLSRDEMLIEASYGLGEAVVSGGVSPDRFAVSRQDFRDTRTELGRKSSTIPALGAGDEPDPSLPSLTPDQVPALCALATKVEELFGKPMDIEWGLAEGRFALLQCRPIEGLDVLRDVETGRQSEVERLWGLAGGRRRVWVAHNLGETLRAPTPLTWDIIRRFMSGSGGFGLIYQDLGYQPSEEVRKDGFLELIGGRVYADPDRLAQLFWAEMPWVYDLDALRSDPRLLEGPPSKLDPDRTDSLFLLRLPRTLLSMARCAKRVRKAQKTARAEFEREANRLCEYVAAKRQQDLSGLSTPELVAELDERRARVLDDFGKVSLKPGFFGGLAFRRLSETLSLLGGKHEGESLALTLTSGLEGDIAVEQSLLLHQVALGERPLTEFLERFGHRAAQEMELAEPRWWEDPACLRQALGSLKAGKLRPPNDAAAESVKRRQAAERSLPDTLAGWGGSSFLEEVQGNLGLAQTLLPFRERGKHFLMMGYDLIRRAILALAARWDIGKDTFFLELDELGRFEADRVGLLETVAARKLRWRSFQRLTMPEFIDSEDLVNLGLASGLPASTEFPVRILAPGSATGRARVILEPGEASGFDQGDILVCPSTDPGWAPLLMHAGALIVERGGALSHGAIVARDLGIPAVACPDATRRVRDGWTVQVDALQGLMRISESHADRRP
jgi:pyruvate,water dikinase